MTTLIYLVHHAGGTVFPAGAIVRAVGSAPVTPKHLCAPCGNSRCRFRGMLVYRGLMAPAVTS